MQVARVVKHMRDNDGRPIGIASNIPQDDTREYKAEYPDGYKVVLLANQVAENLYAEIDRKGRSQVLLYEVIDHQQNKEVFTVDQATNKTINGIARYKPTTKG